MDEIFPFVANEIYEASSRKIRLATFVIKKVAFIVRLKEKAFFHPKFIAIFSRPEAILWLCRENVKWVKLTLK